MGLTVAGAVVVAWSLDAAFGEPPDAFHPVAWLGRVLGPIGRRTSALSPVPAFIGGASAWTAIALLIGCAAWFVEHALGALHPLLRVLLLALLLKPCFAWRMLRDEVAAVEQALARSLADGRLRVARLCSRDVAAMDAFQVRETAIETLAENLNDSLVAPLFWFVVAGLPGAAIYRFANTTDAMWGYRGRTEWSGKWAARADDVLSWLPARLTALLIVPLYRARGLRAEASRTPSPNGGWPMAAMALVLGIRLRKPGVYVLNGSAPSPDSAAVARALRVASRAAWSATAIAAFAGMATASWR